EDRHEQGLTEPEPAAGSAAAKLLRSIPQRLGRRAQIALNLLVVHQGLRTALAVRHPRVSPLRSFERDADVLAKLRILDQPPHVGVGRDGPGSVSGLRASALCPHGSPQIVFQGADAAYPVRAFPSRLGPFPSSSREVFNTSPMSYA